MKQMIRRILTACLVMAPLVCGETCIHAWFDAKKLEEAGRRAEADERYRQCFEMAVAEGNANYGWPAASRAAYGIHRSGRHVEAGEFSLAAYRSLMAMPNPSREQTVLVRCELLGLVERGLLVEGRIGAAWRTSRLAASALRGEAPDPESDAAPIRLAELDTLPESLHTLAFRLIERQADYLDLTGRSGEALDLITAASERAARDWSRLGPQTMMYAFKVRARHAELVDFLGFPEQAMALQRSLLADASGIPRLRAYSDQQRVNLLRNLSQWEGPSEEILAEARAAGERYAAASPAFAHGVEQLLARMELDLHESRDAIAMLAAALATAERRGDTFDALYRGRDFAVARARLGDDVPDEEFARLLAAARAQGNKRAEPTLYTEYARHLARQGRIDEAAPLLREALRLVRVFGRPLHQFPILCSLLDLAVDAGDPEQIRAALAELESAVAGDPEIPAERMVRVAVARAHAFTALDQAGDARAALTEARIRSKDLPGWQTRWLAPEIEEQLLAIPITTAADAAGDPPPVSLQPAEITTLASPGERAETRLVLLNPAALSTTGTLTASGPGVRFKGRRLVADPAAPAADAAIELRLRAGEEILLPAEITAAPDDCTIDLRWSDPRTPPIRWSLRRDPAASGLTVHDASLLDGNPFQAIVLHHRVAPPAGAESRGFRIVAPEPLRLEYYDSLSGTLLAVDANGDGDFSGKGDFHPGGPAAAAVTVTHESAGLFEIRVFGAHGTGPQPLNDPVTLRAEVHHDGEWRLEAESVLR